MEDLGVAVTRSSASKKVFISYSSRDRIEALALKNLIEGEGHDAWMDVFDIKPAAKLAAELANGVRSVDVLCILLSPTAVVSRWVQDEIEHARAAAAMGVTILPVLLRPAEIPPSLSDIVAIDATRGLDDPAVLVRLQQFFGGSVPEGLRLDAFQRSELADRAARNEAETAFPGIRKDLERVWDQPLRDLTLDIDHDEWPDVDGSVLEILIDFDSIFLGCAHILLAPYVEGGTWPAGAQLEERPPDEFFASEKPRIDARFLWAGRELVLRPHLDGTDLGEQPISFTITLDGAEYPGGRGNLTHLVTRFELPPIRALAASCRITLWRHPRDGNPVEIDRRTTDLDLTLDATVRFGDERKSRCIWHSRYDRAAQVLLQGATLTACATDLERDVLLGYRGRPLRQRQTSTERRIRITNAVEHGAPVDEVDRWAAFHLLVSQANLSAFRGARADAGVALNRAINLVLESFEPQTARYEQFFAVWSCASRLVQLLSDGGESRPLRHYLDLIVGLSRQMHSLHVQEPDYVRALAKALALRAEVMASWPHPIDRAAIDEAASVLDQLAAAKPLPWRIGEAQEMRARLAKVEAQEMHARLAKVDVNRDVAAKPLPTYARWLDAAAASDEVPMLLMSALPTYSAKVSHRAGTGKRRLHLVDEELVSVHTNGDSPGWFSIGCCEVWSREPPPLDSTSVLSRAPFPIVHPGRLEVRAWEPAETGDVAERWGAKDIHGARGLLQTGDGSSLRAYHLVVDTARFRWTISLVFPITADDWRGLVGDDATAALTFRSLKLDT